jgi:amino acid transporter
LGQPTLRRSIGFPLLTLYGLGTILGAGIYVLIGEVARVAGTATPSAFVISAFIAAFTALSYAELSGRVPKSAGEAAYVQEGFRRPTVAAIVGWAVIASGVVSSATLVRGFIGYLDIFVRLPPALSIILVVALLTLLAAWGISESLAVAGAFTCVEVAGLLLVCLVAGDSLGELPERWPALLPGADAISWIGVMSGAFIAFYAFIGFEDMVNVAEEVKHPERTLPNAIIAVLLVSTVLYLVVATVATLAVPQERLAGSSAPLADVMYARGLSPTAIALISLFAVINGALIQLIMASRVLYGMGSQGLAWAGLAWVHPGRQTPVVATALVSAVILVLALSFSLDRLARVTSFIALGIFAAVNVALLQLKRRERRGPEFTIPGAFPWAGALLCVGMMLYQLVLVSGSWFG